MGQAECSMKLFRPILFYIEGECEKNYRSKIKSREKIILKRTTTWFHFLYRLPTYLRRTFLKTLSLRPKSMASTVNEMILVQNSFELQASTLLVRIMIMVFLYRVPDLLVPHLLKNEMFHLKTSHFCWCSGVNLWIMTWHIHPLVEVIIYRWNFVGS